MNLLWERLRSSLWPIPLLMLLSAFLLVQGTRMVDDSLAGKEAFRIWWLHSGTGEDAWNLLATLAAAIITISSIVFSITIVALSLAANQFGSRLVRAYMRDVKTKLALGFFLLTVVFCLLGLRLVSHDMSRGEVPHVTVTTGLVLSVACVLVLVFFLHFVARSIIADEVIRRVAEELDGSIDALAPAAPADAPAASSLLPEGFESGSELLRSGGEGYVQEIHYERMAAFAAAHDLVLRLDVAAGDYVCQDGWMGRVFPGTHCSPELLALLRDAVVLGAERTPVQDLAFPVRHLVDIALRALSPGINDANTALVVIDRVRGALARLFGKSMPSGHFHDERGRCRLVGRRRSHADVFATALHPIRDAAAAQPLVIVAMIEALAKLAEHARHDEHLQLIESEAARIREAALLTPVTQSQVRALDVAAGALAAKLVQVRALALAQV